MRGRAAAGIAVVMALVACGTSQPSAPSSSAPPVVVPGPAAAYSSVSVSADGRDTTLTEAQWRPLAPLLAARSFPPPEPLGAYGLDPPAARLVYHRPAGSDITVEVGAAGFDAHFVYVMVEGEASVFSVASAELRPVLALVGVTVPQPTG